MTPRVSILIPCYNAERWIAATLDSVYAQSWPNLQVILVNDGSTDGTARVLERYRHRGLKVIEQQNSGQPAAFNRGLLESDGEFIQYLDADDILHPEKISRQMARLRDRADCIATAEWSRFTSNIAEADFTKNPIGEDMSPVDWLVDNWRDGGGMMYPALWLLPREVVESIGPWREELTLTNEMEYFTRAVLRAAEVLACPGSMTYYRSGNPGTLSTLKTARGWASQFAVTALCETHVLTRENSDGTRRACSMLWQRFAHGCYPYDRALANAGLARAAALHPARLDLDGGGPRFRVASRLLGWKMARILQVASGRP
jgi:glycosyltransferase involved in cell wall biosynthesis